MGNKKRNPTPRSKQSAAASSSVTQSATGGAASDSTPAQPESPPQPDPSVAFSTIKLECERAINAIKSGSHNKALKLIKDLCHRHENSAHSAFIHRIQSIIYREAASIIDDPSKKQMHMQNAIESARKAVDLSPCSIEFAQFYAHLLYDTAKYWTEHEQVVKECVRALGISNPIDPAEETLKDEIEQKISTAEARIAHVQNELQLLIQKSKIASLSLWEKEIQNKVAKLKKSATENIQTEKTTDEIKKVAKKTHEERRKEIEAQVAAARMLQGDPSSGLGQRISERRKSGGHHVRKEAAGGSTSGRRDMVRSYWNSISINSKKEFLRINVSDLRFHFASSKDTAVLNEFIREALSFAAANNKSWKFWLCCYCTKSFSSSESLTQHVRSIHVGILLPEMQKLLPQNVDNDWIEMILNYSWKPVDSSASVKMLEDQAKSKGIEVEGLVADSLSYGWPVSNDSVREKLLERIHAEFNMLIRRKGLAASHLNKVIKFSMDEIQVLAAGSQLMNQRLELSPTCICFLEAPQLQKILEFLEEVSRACDKSKSTVQDLPSISQILEIKENIALNEDASCLLLDECLVRAEIAPGAIDDPFLSWIFSGSSCGEELKLFMKRKEDKRPQGIELFQTLENEFYCLRSLSEQKCEQKNYEEALQLIEDLCLEGKKKRGNSTELVQQSYESILNERKEELVEGESDISNRIKLDAITNVLKEADAMTVNQSHKEDDEERMKDHWHQMESYIEIAIQKLKENHSVELGKTDAQIMRSVTNMKHLELKLDPASAYDFRETLLPIVKSYLRARLEDLAERDATEKSEAATQELLAELALEDSKKDVVKAKSDKKTKDKKKKGR